MFNEANFNYSNLDAKTLSPNINNRLKCMNVPNLSENISENSNCIINSY